MSTFNEQLAQLEEYQSGIKNLEASGITEAYECNLRKYKETDLFRCTKKIMSRWITYE
jgi:hypothetical protein